MLFQYLLGTIVQKGSLKLITADGKAYFYGDGTPPHIVVELHRKDLEWTLALNPDLKIGEAYVDGDLTIEEGDVYDFLMLLQMNYMETGDRAAFHWREHFYPFLARFAEMNPIPRARSNAEFHYDMPDKLYTFFLDKDRQYSCGYFSEGNKGLDEAQLDKKRHIASKLKLDKPDLRVLDIGSGWGGLGLYLAREAGCRVRGITLSTNQYKISNDRVMASSLGKKCSFALRDYRQEEGPYDRIVSVGMFEHVGKRNYNEFFESVRRLLADDGVCLLHAIGRFGEPRPINGFMRKHIFPGSDLPSLDELFKSVSRAGLFVTDLEILRLHYAETLRRWLTRFRGHRDEIVHMFGEKLFRKWEFYFAGAETAFRLGGLMVFQLQLTKQLEAVPLTRDYMFDWERAHQGVSHAPARIVAGLTTTTPLRKSKARKS